MNVLTIDGRDFHSDAAACVHLFLLVAKIIGSGDHQLVIADGDVDGEPIKTAVHVGPTTTLSLVVESGALSDEVREAFGGNIEALDAKYWTGGSPD